MLCQQLAVLPRQVTDQPSDVRAPFHRGSTQAKQSARARTNAFAHQHAIQGHTVIMQIRVWLLIYGVAVGPHGRRRRCQHHLGTALLAAGISPSQDP